MPEFANSDMPDTDIIEYDPLLDSSNIGVNQAVPPRRQRLQPHACTLWQPHGEPIHGPRLRRYPGCHLVCSGPNRQAWPTSWRGALRPRRARHLHGTDTMAYTASALFMLQGLGKPVVPIAWIIPMCEVYTTRGAT